AVRLLAKVELGSVGPAEGLEAAAAGQLEARPDMAYETEVVLLLVDVEGELNRLHDPVGIGLRPEGIGLVHLLEMLVRGADLIQVQSEHELPNIPSTSQLREL